STGPVRTESCCSQNKPAQTASRGQHTCGFSYFGRRCNDRFHRALGSFSRSDGSRKDGSSVPSLYGVRIDFAHPYERRDENSPRVHIWKCSSSEGNRYPCTE